MYLYHYPDIWFDYATWHAKSGSIDSAIKVYQRSLKALPGNSVKTFIIKSRTVYLYCFSNYLYQLSWLLDFMCRLCNAKVCLCWTWGIPRGNSGIILIMAREYVICDHPFSNFLVFQAAKKVYESLLGDGANTTALSHIQVICNGGMWMSYI